MFKFDVLGLNAAGILKPFAGEKVEANGTKDLSRALVTWVKGGFDASLVLGVRTVRKLVWRTKHCRVDSGRCCGKLWLPCLLCENRHQTHTQHNLCAGRNSSQQAMVDVTTGFLHDIESLFRGHREMRSKIGRPSLL